jgi:hypothetical protein
VRGRCCARVFHNRSFGRFAREEHIGASALCAAVERAEDGHIDADLGGGVIQQRVARPGEGKSGGFRTIILYRAGERAFFVYGFAKSERGNIRADELKAFRLLAGNTLSKSEEDILADLKAGALIEVICNEGR